MMATKTANYNLTKPDLTDWADIRVLNANMDIIDNEMKAISNRVATGGTSVDLSDYALKSSLNNYLPITGGNISGKLTINGNEVATKSATKVGTTAGDELTSWKTYLPDGRVMMKLAVGSQSTVTLPKAMANTQYSVLHCDETVETRTSETKYVASRGVKDKTTTSFKVYSVRLVGDSTYLANNWNERYTGSCECIVIGWEA